MSVSSDTCRGGLAPRLVSEDARVQGYSKCFVSLCREMKIGLIVYIVFLQSRVKCHWNC